MANKRPKPEEIVTKLRRFDVCRGMILIVTLQFLGPNTAELQRAQRANHLKSKVTIVPLSCFSMVSFAPIVFAL